MNRNVRPIVIACMSALMEISAAAGEPMTSDAPIQTVVITAQKRSQNIQDVPVAVTALSGDDLAGKATQSLGDLQFAAPALAIAGNGLSQSVNIRGIGLASGSPNVSNGVATYMDGVFQPPIVSSGSFYDIADVEVLRGPQGTFVGSNSTGGAILINSRNPDTKKLSGNVELSAGTYGATGVQGALNVPVNETLAVRAAFRQNKRNSYYVDHGPLNNHPGALDELDGRISVLWKPTTSFQALLKMESIDKKTGGAAFQPVPGTSYASSNAPGIRDLNYNSPTQNNETGQQTTLNLQYVTDGGITLKSITGHQDKKVADLWDTDATSNLSNTSDQKVRERVFTQEFNVLSPVDAPLTWVVGDYYQRNVIDVNIHNGAFPVDILIKDEKHTKGAFGQIGYKLRPDVEVTLGARHSSFDIVGTGNVKIGAGVPGFPASGLQVSDLANTEADGRTTGKINIDWHLDKSNMVYGFVARGYKPGGVNSLPTPNFLQETVDDYELGWKSTSLNGHLRTQLGGFYSRYKNFQYDTVDTNSGQAAVGNVPNATIEGLEAQAQGSLSGTRFDIGAAYVLSKLGDYSVIDPNLLPPGTPLPQCATGQTSNCTDYSNAYKTVSGASNLYSPKLTYNFGVEHGFYTENDLVVTPRLNYAYTGAQEASPAQNPIYHISGRGLLSALLTIEPGNSESWSLQFYGTNLTNRNYVTGFYVNGASGNQYYGAPREFGARLGFKW